MSRVLGAVLAGGQSSRFGSNKAAATLDGRDLLHHAADRLRPHVDSIVVVGERMGGLPDLPRADRADAAERWLAGAAGVTDASLRQRVTRDAMAILDDPVFADLFGPEALAEAPIAAVVGTQVVAGTVDRLCIGETIVRVVDFKTGRRVPQTIDDIPVYHRRQMAAYAAALAVIFPDRSIEAALLYTAGPKLFVLPADLLAMHKPGYGTGEQSLSREA